MGKIAYIHYIRAVAAFFIVAIHTNLFIHEGDDYYRAYSALLAEWTAVFVLISGFLFQHLLPKYEIKRYFKLKLKNVILPYLLISIPAILIYIIGIKNEHNWVDLNSLREHGILYQVFFFYITGSHLGPLWFMPVLFLIYLVSPILAHIGKNKTYFYLLVPICLLVIGLTKRPANDSNVILAFMHFLPVYIIGMFIYNVKDIIFSDKNKGWVLGAALVGAVAFYFWSIAGGNSIAIYQKICVFLILCIFFDAYSASLENTKKGIFLGLLADFSFTIYFIHGYLVGVLRTKVEAIGVGGLLYGTTLNMIFTAIIVAVVVAMILVVKKVFKNRSRMLIGA